MSDLRWYITRWLRSCGFYGISSLFSGRPPLASRYAPVPGRNGFSVTMSRAGRIALRGIRLVIVLSLIIFIGLIIFIIVDRRLMPTLHQIAEVRARVVATEAINDAISKKIAGTIKWEDLYALRPDSRGRVVLVQPNTAELSRLTSDVSIAVQENLKKATEDVIRIPLGQALGSQILANMGPRIPIRIALIGSVKTSILSRFEEAGINQIRHLIYVNVSSTIQVVVPLVSTIVEVTNQAPLTEVIINGEVPMVYVRDGLGSGSISGGQDQNQKSD